MAEIQRRYEARKQEFQSLGHCVLCDAPKEEGRWCCATHRNKPVPWGLNITLASLRPAVMTSDAQAKGTDMAWQMDVPYDTRQLAIKDAISAYRACTSLLTRGHIGHFEMRFQARSSRRIFWVDAAALSQKRGSLRIFQRRLGGGAALRLHSKARRHLPDVISHDAKVLYDRGAYYLVLSLDRPDPIPTARPYRHPIVALDPGVRTFLTGYSPTGVAFKAGEGQIARMRCLHQRIDRLRGVRDIAPRRTTRWHVGQRLAKLERTLSGMVNDMHHQTAAVLTRNFETILLPTFGTSGMLEGDGLPSCVKRRMQGLAHYRFQQKLLGHCAKQGCTLYLVGEHYTTKTCGGCGRLKQVGSDRWYKCDACGYEADRDVHGARNILLKACSEHM